MEAILFDFEMAPIVDWCVVNDVVMGGVSQSQLAILKEGVALFSGKVSIENGGGFASIKCDKLNVQDWTLFDSLLVRIKGDGKAYKLRISGESRVGGVGYLQEFHTRNGEWEELELPFEAFVPSFRGKVLDDYPSMNFELVKEIGFLISGRQAGVFNLKISWIKLVSPDRA